MMWIKTFVDKDFYLTYRVKKNNKDYNQNKKRKKKRNLIPYETIFI